MFNYDPISEEEALKERYQLLKDGEYEGFVETATARISSSNNPMIELVLTVYDENGKSKTVKDFLVFTKQMMWKVIHCCKSTGTSKEYLDGKLCAEILVGKNLRVSIGTQTGSLIPNDKLNGKAPGARYPDKNIVEDYLERSPSSKPPMTKSSEDFVDDAEIPF